MINRNKYISDRSWQKCTLHSTAPLSQNSSQAPPASHLFPEDLESPLSVGEVRR